MASGDLAGAETALQGLDKFNGFEPLKIFQLGLLYDYAGKPDKARQFYDKAIGANEQLNWRVTEIVANFEERQGRSEQAQALYDRFVRQNSSSDLATAVAAIRAAGPPKPPICFAFRRARRGAVRSRQRAEPARDGRSGAVVRPRRAGAAAAIPARGNCCSPTY